MKPAVPENIIISRTDSIGDVVLTLPMAKILKDQYPDMHIAFMGKSYTKPVIECCSFIDEFIDVADFLKKDIKISGQSPKCIVHVFPQKEIALRAKTLKIPIRIGTTNRLYHWGTCNKLVRLSRKNSLLHEAQLNIRLLVPLGIKKIFSLPELGKAIGFKKIQPLLPEFQNLIDADKFNLILHPKSQGSAREWGLKNFMALINLLPQKNFKIFISGTSKERELLIPLIEEAGKLVTDISGKMDLGTFISFINHCDGLVANSTGPLHIAGALGKTAIGIYPDVRPMNPGRWQALGSNVQFVVSPGLDLSVVAPQEILSLLMLSKEFLTK